MTHTRAHTHADTHTRVCVVQGVTGERGLFTSCRQWLYSQNTAKKWNGSTTHITESLDMIFALHVAKCRATNGLLVQSTSWWEFRGDRDVPRHILGRFPPCLPQYAALCLAKASFVLRLSPRASAAVTTAGPCCRRGEPGGHVYSLDPRELFLVGDALNVQRSTLCLFMLVRKPRIPRPTSLQCRLHRLICSESLLCISVWSRGREAILAGLPEGGAPKPGRINRRSSPSIE